MTDGHAFEHGGAGSLGQPGADLIVPLFPLPNVVLFPSAVLPLHIFEERYKTMTRNALAGDRLIGMALLKPGWEKHYYGRPPVEPVVCVGRILSHEGLPDGRFNFLLQGVTRARLVGERSADDDGRDPDVAEGPSYRVGRLRPIEVPAPDPAVDEAGRTAVAMLLGESPLGRTPLGRKFADLARSPFPLPDLVDLLAFNFVEDVSAKQAMLAEPDVGRRLPLLLEALGATPARPPVSDSVRRARRLSMN